MIVRRDLALPAVLGAVVFSFLAAGSARGQEASASDTLPSVAEKTRGMTPLRGFVDLYWDGSSGRLYMAVDRWGEEFLYQVSLATGLGSNPVGLDRGQLGGTHVVEARRAGPRVLLVEVNYGYRARSQDSAERQAVREAFAPSTLWGFEVVAESGDEVLVDATEFFLRDAHGIAEQLRRTGQGEFRLAADRSVVHLAKTHAFPRNTEVEAWLTFTSERPGELVRATAASGEAVSFRVHHSLVRLPDPEGHRPRSFDPRVNAFPLTFHDYAAPIDESLQVRWAVRHRLHRTDPGAASSPAVEPLVYYVDPGIPEPVRSAVIEGASWWEEAFTAAGYDRAFRVRVLPDTADPMDLRYNVIHWTHRRTRGWSYGSSVVDPRTGEILKANVNLGSLRLRQDRLIGAGLRPPYVAADASAGTRSGAHVPGRRSGAGVVPLDRCDMAAGPTFGYLAAVAQDVSPAEMALARVRQLAAHEVGHTLGFAHNYIASTYGRASVMDYPAPVVRVSEAGELDLSDAYDVGIGAFDRFAVNWLYREFPEGRDEAAALDSIVRDGLRRGMRFITDRDARPEGAAHPLAALWDNGGDPVEGLRHELRVRRAALEDFGPGAIRPGQAISDLEQLLVPLYLHHRYQLEAASHSLGGVDYAYALRGDGQTAMEMVPAGRQRAALDVMLLTLEPEFLALPERLLRVLPPPAFGTPDEAELFGRRTAPAFDPLGVAASAAGYTLDFLLQPERMARLVDHHARDGELPGLEEVVTRLLERTWRAREPSDAYRAALQRTVQRVVLDRLLDEAGSARNTELVRATLNREVRDLAAWLDELSAPNPTQELALEEIRRWQARDADERDPSRVDDLPPGSPIGDGGG